ncbi:MAG: glycoside hydrolase family 3 C-terminal domain-containing protein, partial [Muribaculaceae bacterium]|nr:glycoside hydrolase family 3 C-terminal domain-containing protein [Muribaculaceae bacterium]
NSASEGEGSDRSGSLPAAAQEAIDATVNATSKPLVTVVNGGGNVYLWDLEPRMDAVLWGWYGGQEAGRAMAEILLGDVNPSGKLPVTFEKRWADNPTYNSYYDDDNDKHVKFTEGIFVGYRGYDRNKTDVQYPFGHGLSYTTFALSDLSVRNVDNGDNTVAEVSFNIRNTGSVAGAEVVQVYVGKDGASPVERPVRELKNYDKIYLEPGEQQTVILTLDKDAFSYYDVTEGVKDFVVDNGNYKIEVGVSSRDIRLTGNLTVDWHEAALETPVAATKAHNLRPSAVKAGESAAITLGIASEVEIFGMAGTLVSAQSNTHRVSTGRLSPGIYVVRYTVDGTVYTEKLTVM